MTLDWTQVTLLLYMLMRISGFVLFSPLLGRKTIPGVVRAGIILVLTVFLFSTVDGGAPVPETLVEFVVRILLELALGFVLGFVMQIFFTIPPVAGFIIDTQMGMSMATIYDPSSQATVSVTGNFLNMMMTLLFFVGNGHLTMLRILLTSGDVVSFGAVSLGPAIPNAIAELFIECMLLALKLALPILAAELIGEVGMGILMKAIPQINVFVINIELKVIVGLALLIVMITPFSEFLLGVELDMLNALGRVLSLAR